MNTGKSAADLSTRLSELTMREGHQMKRRRIHEDAMEIESRKTGNETPGPHQIFFMMLNRDRSTDFRYMVTWKQRKRYATNAKMERYGNHTRQSTHSHSSFGSFESTTTRG